MTRRHDEGAFTVIALLVAGAIVVAAFAIATSLTAHEVATTRGESTELRSMAENTMNIIVSQTGFTESGVEQWDSDADTLERFGLASSLGENFLDGEKILAMNQAKMSATANGFPDYAEVRGALGLPTGVDFHLRSYPLVYSVLDDRFNSYRNMQVAYIANYENSGVVPPPENVVITTSAADMGDYTQVTFTSTCPATGPTQDVYLFTLRLDTGTGSGSGTITSSHYTPIIKCDNVPVSFSHRIENLNWVANSAGWELRYDAKSLITDNVIASDELAASVRDVGTDAYTLSVQSDLHNFAQSEGEAPSVSIDKRERDGGRHMVNGISATVKAFAPGVDPATGSPAETKTVTLTKSQPTQVDFTTLTPIDGTWNVVVTTTTAKAESRFTYTATPLTGDTLAVSALAQAEIDVLDELVRTFDPTLYSASGGDVFRDTKEDTARTLGYPPSGTGKIDDFDIVVIGSGVDTSALEAQFPEDLRSWVDAGGMLVAFGSPHGPQWLQRSTAWQIDYVDAAGNAITTPDPTHPFLHSPDELRFRDYQNLARAYGMDENLFEGFSHIIVNTIDATTSEDFLALSKPGVYGRGTVVLTSFFPTDLFAGGSVEDEALEAKKFVNNLLSRRYQQIQLDYGPTIPNGLPVESTTRLVVVPHPEEPRAFVEIRLVLYVWK